VSVANLYLDKTRSPYLRFQTHPPQPLAAAMSENTAPATASSSTPTQPSAPATANMASSTAAPSQGVPTSEARGMPYYEKLRRDLRDTIARKRQLDRTLQNIEESIFKYENSYLEETTAGNIIRGFDNYIKGTSTAGGAGGGSMIGGSSRRRINVSEAERIFSGSSAGAIRVRTESFYLRGD
jgi:chromatin modification-related protein EAF6